MSNLLAMPLISMTVLTGNNEDWIDSIKYVVDDGSSAIEDMPQLDLGELDFYMEVRRRPEDNEVVVRASTKADGGLAVGVPPNNGFLLINVLWEKMHQLVAGQYVADIVGKDVANATRRVALITLTVAEGITRP